MKALAVPRGNRMAGQPSKGSPDSGYQAIQGTGGNAGLSPGWDNLRNHPPVRSHLNGFPSLNVPDIATQIVLQFANPCLHIDKYSHM